MCPIGDTCPNGNADCASGYCDMSASPAVCACNENDPLQDCDKDGNPNGEDPNPTVPTAVDDGVFTGSVGTADTYDILGNDDFLTGSNTSIVATGGTYTGTVSFDPLTGEMTYTPDPSEAGTTVTVEYEVCNTAVTPEVCDTATVTIDVTAVCDTASAGNLNAGVCPIGDECPNGNADCASGYCDMSASPAVCACNPNDATADCDMDGNPNGTDPNPDTPIATDDGTYQ